MRAQIAPGVFQQRYGLPLDVDHGTGPTLRALLRGDWKQHGACASIDSEQWFAEASTLASREAATTCARCPVRGACLASALVFDEEFGVWGGLDPHQRQPLTRRLKAGEPLDVVLSSAFDVAAAVEAA